MKKNEVSIGKTYWANVTGLRVPVRIESASPHGGWIGRSIKTGREIRIKTAGRLHGECDADEVADVSAKTRPNRRSRKKPPVKIVASKADRPKGREATKVPKGHDKAKQRQAILDAIVKILTTKKPMTVGEIHAALADKDLLASCGEPTHGAIYYALKFDIDQNKETRFARKATSGVTSYLLRKKK